MSRTIIIGISGPSSSGKTTLARLLRDILLAGGVHTFVLHEDDFYVTDQDIPVHKETGYQDWDCIEAIDVELFSQAVKHIKDHNEPPPQLHSKEDQNSVGEMKLDHGALAQLREQATTLLSGCPKAVAIIDGFLLYDSRLTSVYGLIDVRLFLPLTRQLMLSRRAARTGYVTLEGFWQDPPGYVEKVVWPNYATDHAYLFKNGDVEAELNDEAGKLALHVAPRETMQDLTSSLQWACRIVFNSLTASQ